MTKTNTAILLVVLSIFFSISAVCARIMGDVNNDNAIDLADSIMALQVQVGVSTSQPLSTEADVNNDGKIGLEEATYALQITSGVKLIPAIENWQFVTWDGQVIGDSKFMRDSNGILTISADWTIPNPDPNNSYGDINLLIQNESVTLNRGVLSATLSGTAFYTNDVYRKYPFDFEMAVEGGYSQGHGIGKTKTKFPQDPESSEYRGYYESKRVSGSGVTPELEGLVLEDLNVMCDIECFEASNGEAYFLLVKYALADDLGNQYELIGIFDSGCEHNTGEECTGKAFVKPDGPILDFSYIWNHGPNLCEISIDVIGLNNCYAN